MAGTLIFGLFALVHWCVALAALSVADTLLLPALCLFLIAAVTAFDNAVTAFGKRLGVSKQAEQINRRRYLFHATCIGFMLPVYSGIGRVVAFSSFGALLADILAWLLAIGIGLYGYFYQYKSTGRLMPVNYLGCLRYTESVTDISRYPGYDYSEEELRAKASAPLASIATVMLGLIYAVLIGWFGGLWLPLVVTAIMLLPGVLPQRPWTLVVTSSVEIVMMAGLLYSLWYAASVASAGI